MKRTILSLAFLLVPTWAFAQNSHDPVPTSGMAKATTGPRAVRGRNNGATVRPRLVVILVADMFRLDYLNRFAVDFGEGGFRRLLGEGAVWTGKYGQ